MTDRANMSVKLLVALCSLACGALPAAAQEDVNDYPTIEIVDYVYGCMRANGESREALAACSCSADVVASLLPYERYEEARTFLSMMQATGEGAALFRETAESRAAITDLRRAQAEAEIRCFKGAG